MSLKLYLDYTFKSILEFSAKNSKRRILIDFMEKYNLLKFLINKNPKFCIHDNKAYWIHPVHVIAYTCDLKLLDAFINFGVNLALKDARQRTVLDIINGVLCVNNPNQKGYNECKNKLEGILLEKKGGL